MSEGAGLHETDVGWRWLAVNRLYFITNGRPLGLHVGIVCERIHKGGPLHCVHVCCLNPDCLPMKSITFKRAHLKSQINHPLVRYEALQLQSTPMNGRTRPAHVQTPIATLRCSMRNPHSPQTNTHR